ncbi:MAG: hypothetical protein C5B50_03540 [Verrucomicrobia bacterium]|nr:MAG: hypothetical protein C5B50_03540 [Verrucomicrobiota bacterium]
MINYHLPTPRSGQMTVAVGFSPRIDVAISLRRVATLEPPQPIHHNFFKRRYATQTSFDAGPRGLKPTATFMPSLRDAATNSPNDPGPALPASSMASLVLANSPKIHSSIHPTIN